MAESCDRRRQRGNWTEDSYSADCRFPIGALNTYSNVAYAIAGTWLAWQYQDSASAAMGLAFWLLATGSGLYHGYKTLPANRLDWLGMLAVCGALVSHSALPGWPGVSWFMLGLGGVAGYWYLSQRRVHFDLVVAAAVGLATIRPLIDGDRLLVLVSVLVFGASYGLWQLDKRRSPLVGRYGHAGWHVGTAAALTLLYVAAL